MRVLGIILMQNRNSLGLICQKSEGEVRQIHCRAKCYYAKACLLLLTPSCIRYTHDYSHTTLARTHTHKPAAQFCVRCGGSATAGRGKGLLQGAASCTAHVCDFPFPGFSPAGRSRDSRVESRDSRAEAVIIFFMIKSMEVHLAHSSPS